MGRNSWCIGTPRREDFLRQQPAALGASIVDDKDTPGGVSGCVKQPSQLLDFLYQAILAVRMLIGTKQSSVFLVHRHHEGYVQGLLEGAHDRFGSRKLERKMNHNRLFNTLVKELLLELIQRRSACAFV